MQYLIDASVYVFRAYYSVPDDMVDDNGNPVNALYGFVVSLVISWRALRQNTLLFCSMKA